MPVDKLAPSDAKGSGAEDSVPSEVKPERRRRDLLEVSVGYGFVLLAIWTLPPWQRWFSWAALAWVLLATALSFDGWSALGLRGPGFLRSLWIVGAALLLAAAAVTVSARLDTLHVPRYPSLFIRRFWAYAIFALLQEFLLLDFFLLRLLRLLQPRKTAAVMATTGLFALAHLPNPVLTPVTLLWGCIACLLFLRYRNLYTLAMTHAIFGICIAVTIPGPVDHNMRVGLSYFTYRPHHAILAARVSHQARATSGNSFRSNCGRD